MIKKNKNKQPKSIKKRILIISISVCIITVLFFVGKYKPALSRDEEILINNALTYLKNNNYKKVDDVSDVTTKDDTFYKRRIHYTKKDKKTFDAEIDIIITKEKTEQQKEYYQKCLGFYTYSKPIVERIDKKTIYYISNAKQPFKDRDIKQSSFLQLSPYPVNYKSSFAPISSLITMDKNSNTIISIQILQMENSWKQNEKENIEKQMQEELIKIYKKIAK